MMCGVYEAGGQSAESSERVTELIEGNRCGIVVPPDDPQSFADAVIRLRDDPDELVAMGRRARQLAESQFSRDVFGDQLVAVLEFSYQDSSRRRSPTPTRPLGHE